ncbi:RlpA-like double-psi beta-barrel-protein domain-containing protein-containing protein [Xylariomycetidae sp. FL0641]|nr:RlpA-like double-psi beta-barrel-protein domain-containing protein-containing protein [Xylariomycetidae sp. FL0641]
MYFTKAITLLAAAVGSAVAAPAQVQARSAGDMTYYTPGLGACGQTNTEGEAVVALSPADYAGACGKTISIQMGGGGSAKAKVVDKCPGCAAGSIDVSPSVFSSLADLAEGRVKVSWSFE